MNRLALTVTIWLFCLISYAQCPTILSSNTTFTKDGVCAPVNVTTYTSTYTFLSPQDPNDIEIIFDWDDGSAPDTFSNGAGLVVMGGNTIFEATGTHNYAASNDCAFVPEVSLEFQGGVCETTSQTVVVWDDDDNFGGVMAIDPAAYTICENTAIVNAVFTDNTTFNCNANANDPTIANREARWTQFVYGTNYVAGAIRDLTIDDGGAQVITNAAGNLASPDTRGTAGLMVTAGYFGVPTEVPFPADNPTNVSLPVSAPANIANAVGSTFEITLFNWNTCNPYNGDPNDPNYEDAVSETVTITIIDPPVPDFEARDQNAGGAALTEFCINEDIFFANLTGGVGPYNYAWEFYEGDNDGTAVAGNSNQAEPTFQYTTGGDKLIRLTATDANANGTCDVVHDEIITLSPDAVADFEFYDATFTSTRDPDFCQTGSDVFTVGFRDNTVDVANTEYIYEFYDEGGALISTEPTNGIPLPDPIPDFTRDFSTEEFVVIRLVATNTASSCSSFEQDTVAVYGLPIATFATNEICEGERTSFTALTDQLTGFNIRVNDDIIDTYEWDFSYDGMTFNTELIGTDDSDFDWYLDGTNIALGAEPGTSAAGTYDVALRLTSQKGSCTDLFVASVVIHPNPDSQVSHDATGDLCPGDEIDFSNDSSNPALTMQYFLEVSHPPSGYFNSTTLTSLDTLLSFPNPDDTTRTYESVIRAITDESCETVSSVLTFRVSPDEESGFSDDNYDLFNSNCSPWASTLTVDQATQDLLPDAYQWTISDENGVVNGYPVSKVNTDPDFHTLDYDLENTTNAIINFEAVLEVTKAGVCVSNDTFNLQISPQPFADYSLIRDEDCNEVVLELEATQKGLTSYNWTFDPAPGVEFGSDDERLISYTREADTGNDFDVTITLSTTNLAGCPSEAVVSVETIEKQRPAILADFDTSADTVQLPDATITLTNTSTADAGFAYLWEFGDDSTNTIRDPGIYTYQDFGSFQINLTVIDGFCEVETAKTVVVLPADPVLDFEADTLQGCTPLTIRFTNLSQNAVSGEYLWEFGDGSISELDNPVHTYFDGGSFDVRLRGTNNVGVIMETTKEGYIESFGRPFADFLVSARVVFIPDQNVAFRNLSQNAVEYFWDFGDGTTSTDVDPVHNYTEEGFYDITLVAINELGCADTLHRAAEVEAIIGGETNSPNAFTPNLSGPNGGSTGGGLNVNSVNDIFLPRLEGVTRFKMFIYNKWGQLLFRSEDQNVGWDGYYKGRLAPAGVYIYKLEVRYSDDRDEIIAGDVTLIR